MKSFHIDGRFDVIATGSLLGVKGYGQSKKKKAKPNSERRIGCGFRISGLNVSHADSARTLR